MPPQPDETEIRQRVTRRWRARLRLAVHMFLTLPAMAVFALVGEEGAKAMEFNRFSNSVMYAAACMFMVWISSVLIHMVWLLFSELSERAVQREIDRQWQLASLSYDKPKRGVSLLSVMSDDGLLPEALDNESQSVRAARR